MGWLKLLTIYYFKTVANNYKKNLNYRGICQHIWRILFQTLQGQLRSICHIQ